ncbi:uncharacterized protein LOC121481428 [Vulpes lagopus]|uniref:uncharacterized protein LOC121481428 n=1 Tax=Vulpes lagopus TaxID=494514 RepID=UPI001BCA518F|nr:uncharacterized protein LOC121481428 [Vulpes lagopus]
MLNTLGSVLGVLFWEGVEGNRYCPSDKLQQRPSDQPPATPPGSKAGPKRRRVPQAPEQVHSSPTRRRFPAQRYLPSQTLGTRPHPPPGSRETEVAAEIQGRKRRGKGAGSALHARPRGRSGALGHLRLDGGRRGAVCGGERGGETGGGGGGGAERREGEVSAPGRSLQVSLVRSPGVRGCTELHGFLARPTPALSLCKHSPCWRRGHRDGGCGRRLPRGLPARRGPAPALPGCLRGLGGHLRDRCEPGRRQRGSHRGCCARPEGAESPPPTAVSCCPRAAQTWSDISTGMPRQLPPLAEDGRGNVSTRSGDGSLLRSCRPARPPPRPEEGRIPETAAPDSVEAGLVLPVALWGFFPLVIFQCES